MANKNTSVCDKLGLIVWKNLIIRKRHWLLTIFEFFMPIALFLIIVYVNIESNINMSGDFNNKDVMYSQPMDMNYLQKYLSSNSEILYTKNTDLHNEIMEKTRMKLNLNETQLHGFENEESMMVEYGRLSSNWSTSSNDRIIVIKFDEDNNNNKQLKYKLRTMTFLNTKELFPEFESAPMSYPGFSLEAPYVTGGFLLMQMLIDQSYIELLTKQLSLPFKLMLQGMPVPPYSSQLNMDILNHIYYFVLPLLTTMSFVFLCPSLLTRVVEEKDTGIKELMKLMGLKQWMLWLGWVINSLIINIFSITIIVVILKVVWSDQNGAVLPETNAFLLWIFLFLYVLAGISFCFFMSTLFNKPTIAQGVGVAIWIMSYFVPQSTATNSNTTLITKVLLCVLPNMSVLFGYNAISNLEIEEEKRGLQWSNIFEAVNPEDMSMGAVYGMLIFDIFLYLILTWYLDNIKPGQYGLARPCYFPFTKSYWISTKEFDEGPIEDNHNEHVSNTNYEEPPRNLTAGIKINNLRKTYNNVKAVNGLTMNFYNGEITALLGHNGAGKTTTMSILTGMFSPTSGHVSIHDYNIRTQMGNVRNILGLCPQHNMLFTDLNVQEHLIFFSRLKGKSHKEAIKDSINLLNILNLSSKQNNLTKTLSGGMKRKLSLGIALVGDSQVLMLDEPTSGMDPEARREVWDLLLGMRSPDKVIVITTHFMEEADVLGDRIAIMDHGTLQCYGTSMFLKRKYGAGYQMSLMKVDEHTNVQRIKTIVESQIPNAFLKNENAGLITFTLPTNDNDKFPKLFHTLETSKNELRISGIGLSITTLEDVFLRVGEILDEKQHNNHNLVNGNGGSEYEIGSRQDLLTNRRNSGVILELNRVKILLIKKFLFNKRKYLQFCIFFLIPILMTLFAMIFIKQAVDTKYLSMPPLDLTMDKYDPQDVYYTKNVKASEDLQKISDIYGKLLSKDTNAKPVVDFNKEIIEFGKRNLTAYKKLAVIGGEFNQTDTTITMNAMYSKFATHSTGISLNRITNAVLKFFMGDEYSISIENQPLDTKDTQLVEYYITKIQIISTSLVFFPLGFLSLIGSFMNFPIVERVSNMKQLQLMTGLQACTYWFSTYLYDLMIFVIATVLSMLMIIFFDQTDIYNGTTELWILFGLLILYGFSNIAYCYFVSFKTQTFAGGFKLLLITSLLIGMIGSAITYIFIVIPKDSWKTAGNILHRIFSFFPQYALSNGILKFSNIAINNNKCKTMEMDKLIQKCKEKPDYSCCPFLTDKNYSFSYMDGDSGIKDLFIMLAVNTFLYLILILLIDYNIFGLIKQIFPWIFKSKSSTNYQIQQQLDPDVQREKQRIYDQYNYGQGDDNLIVYELEKRFGRYAAVRGLSFGVHGGECFGLLGVNGAGKTTTFRMITGDEVPTNGDAIANYYKLSRNKKTFLKQLGYCPQFDALNEALTGREMLQTFAYLRGIHTSDIKYEVNKWLSLLGLNDYADRLCGTYSGGNKRKLSTAMALVAEPPIVLLDEPTSGVDPISRRNLWTVLSSIQNKQSIVLTSHSMEECEALCNRLGIMVDGQLTCLGTVPYLKQRFGQGFTVIFKIKSNMDCTNLKANIIHEFVDCELKDEHDGLLNYHIKNPNTTWYQLFGTIERLKSNPQFGGIIEDYTVSETTLEQVFLSFARQQ